MVDVAIENCLVLLAKVLERAVIDATDDRFKHKPERVTANQWFASKRTCEFSFLWVCCVLGVNPKEIRANVRKLSRSSQKFYTCGSRYVIIKYIPTLIQRYEEIELTYGSTQKP